MIQHHAMVFIIAPIHRGIPQGIVPFIHLLSPSDALALILPLLVVSDSHFCSSYLLS